MPIIKQIKIRLALIVLIYLGLNIPIWIALPQHMYNVLVWPKFWLVFIEKGREVYGSMDSIRKFITPLMAGSSLFGVGLIVILLFVWPRQRNSYGKAALATLSLFSKMGINHNTGIILGKFKGKLLRMNEPLSVLLLAPAGTGKTSGIVIPNLLLLKNSVIVHDPKGEIYEKTAKARRQFSRVLLFDPINNNTVRYNVFAKSVLPIRKQDIHPYVENMANILIKGEQGQDNFWMKEAREALCFFTEWLIWKNGETSFPEVRRKLLLSDNIEQAISSMRAAEDITEHLYILGNSVLINVTNPKQWAGVLATLKQALSVFSDESISNATGGISDFTGRSFREANLSLYISVRDRDKDRLAPLIAMVIDSLVTQLISEMPAPESKKITFILDEFVRLGNIKSIIELPSISRGYGVNTIFIAQDHSQIIKTYSKEDLEILETNTAYKIILRQGNMNTAEKISKLIGNQTRIRTSYSRNINSKDMRSSQSRSISEEGIPLISAQEINSLPEGRALILAHGFLHNPIKAELPFYFKDRKMKKLVAA